MFEDCCILYEFKLFVCVEEDDKVLSTIDKEFVVNVDEIVENNDDVDDSSLIVVE